MMTFAIYKRRNGIMTYLTFLYKSKNRKLQQLPKRIIQNVSSYIGCTSLY